MTDLGLLVRYGAAGVATLLAYVAVGSALQWAGVGRLLLLCLPFATAVLLNYLLQRNWVFRDRRPPSASIPKYLAMISVGFAINSAAIQLLTGRLDFLMVQLAAASLVVVSNAMLAFLWVFIRPSPPART